MVSRPPSWTCVLTVIRRVPRVCFFILFFILSTFFISLSFPKFRERRSGTIGSTSRKRTRVCLMDIPTLPNYIYASERTLWIDQAGLHSLCKSGHSISTVLYLSCGSRCWTRFDACLHTGGILCDSRRAGPIEFFYSRWTEPATLVVMMVVGGGLCNALPLGNWREYTATILHISHTRMIMYPFPHWDPSLSRIDPLPTL